MSQKETAVVLGATGLIGKCLIEQLIQDEQFEKVILLTRRETGFNHPKIEELIIDFDQLESYKYKVKGHVLFSCLGTTIKKAGSKEAMYKIDYTYQYQIAKAGFENGISSYVLVSSSGAKASSFIFYTKIKGQLEEAVTALTFDRTIIFRPSVLMGEREENRAAEKVGAAIINLFGKVPFLKKYRGIKGQEVASAMLNCYKNESSYNIELYELDEIFKLI